MKEKGRKIAGVLIALAGILELVVGIGEGTFSTILMGICFCIIGGLYFFEKKKIRLKFEVYDVIDYINWKRSCQFSKKTHR